MSTIAVDWSGAVQPRGKLWLAQALDGRLVRLDAFASREALAAELVAQCSTRPGTVIGLDFSFSMPAWFVRRLELSSAFELWDRVAEEGEGWLRRCDSPFWGRAGTTKPAGLECLRRTELDVSSAFAATPKSIFQLAGAGAVGTGSLRGMPYLAKLRNEGFSIWPFDEPRGPLVVEIYPRLLTGPVVKSSAEARSAYLKRHALPADRALVSRAAESEDAFDAAISALAMERHRGQLRSLAADRTSPYDIEGRIWWPC